MSYLFLRFPGFKRKALSLSYDDCVSADEKMIEIMRKNGIKGTFNVNSGLFGCEGKHLTAQEVKNLYIPTGNEVNIHGLSHATLNDFSDEMIVNEILTDRKNLEQLLGVQVRGMAFPNNSSGLERIKPILKYCGIRYARASGITGKFDLPADWLEMHATCSDFSPELMLLAKDFAEKGDSDYYWDNSPLWFLLYGHARFTFEGKNDGKFTEFCEFMGNRNSVWYATVGQVYRYVHAYETLEFSVDGTCVYNPGAENVYLNYYGKEVVAESGKYTKLEPRLIP